MFPQSLLGDHIEERKHETHLLHAQGLGILLHTFLEKYFLLSENSDKTDILFAPLNTNPLYTENFLLPRLKNTTASM